MDLDKILEYNSRDRSFYEKIIKGYLPEKMVDVHAHIWLKEHIGRMSAAPARTVAWPSMVAADNSAEDLMQTYSILFPGKTVTPMVFSQVVPECDLQSGNEYVRDCAAKHGFPSLMVTRPELDADEMEKDIETKGFSGIKVYLTFSKSYIPEKEIRIFDFIPHHQLEVLNRRGWILMLHIPRDGRLGDPVNLAQLSEIDREYPDISVIIAHVGRAYCPEDVKNAFEVLAKTKNLLFDISANTNTEVFEKLINHIGPKRILFGSDLPVLRMRSGRICENGRYINLIPKGMYGDVSKDVHMREIDGPEAQKLTFLLYEEIDAFRRASEKCGLYHKDIEDVFCNNAGRIIKKAGGRN
jgi:uncharacterized protein